MKLRCHAALWLGLALLGAAGAEAVSCSAAGSLVPNCGFDTDDFGWYISADLVTWTGVDCAHAPGCVQADRMDAVHAVEAISACFPVAVLGEYAFGGSFRRISGVIGQTCVIAARFHAGGECGTFLESTFALFDAGTSWRPQVAGAVTPAGTQSAQLVLSCHSETSDFVVALDDGIFLPAVFVDGFASGDSGRWSMVVP